MSKIIRQTVTINAAPHEVYEALMDERKHARFTGDAAKISRKVGGAISAYGSYITGTNLELVKDRKIVQEWRSSDWPAAALSTVTFALEPTESGTTKLKFSQRGVPDDHYDSIKQGWIDYYWKPLKAMFDAKIANAAMRAKGKTK